MGKTEVSGMQSGLSVYNIRLYYTPDSYNNLQLKVPYFQLQKEIGESNKVIEDILSIIEENIFYADASGICLQNPTDSIEKILNKVFVRLTNKESRFDQRPSLHHLSIRVYFKKRGTIILDSTSHILLKLDVLGKDNYIKLREEILRYCKDNGLHVEYMGFDYSS